MSLDRERGITAAFVSFAQSMTTDYDIADLYIDLTAQCVRLLDVESVGLLLADARGVLHLMAASSEATRDLELLQLQRDEGPCLDCYHSGLPVLAADLSEEKPRWPHFVAAAAAGGIASVHALPMRLHDSVLGTLGLFGAQTGTLDDDDLDLGQALADVASLALVAQRASSDKTAVNEQLQTALNSRVLLEQAKGILAQHGDLGMDESFATLRRYARDHNKKLTDVSRAIVSRELPVSRVLGHALSDGRRPPAG